MGAVYLANHLGLQREFALKMLLPDLVNEQTWLRFKSEARTIAALNHPSIVKVYDLGVHASASPWAEPKRKKRSGLQRRQRQITL